MRTAVIGDVSGHWTPFARALRSLGVDVHDRTLPDDLTIVQVGDLIHKGPDSEAITEAVDQFLTTYPNRWRQLLGNHEAHHVGGPQFARFGDAAADTVIGRVKGWWDAKQIAVAVAVVADTGTETLVTHAGVTRDFYAWIGRPGTATEAAAVINDMARTTPDEVFEPGRMLGGWGPPRTPPGPIWAAASDELYGAWAQAPALPFDQIHGHSSAWVWSTRAWATATPNRVRAVTTVDPRRRHVTFRHGGHKIVGCDPGFGSITPDLAIHPVLVTGKVA